MLDFSKIAQTIGGVFSSQQPAALPDAAQITDILAQAGIDPAILEGLSLPEIANLLAQHGIDPSQLDPAALSELLGNTPEGIAQTAAEWLGSKLR